MLVLAAVIDHNLNQSEARREDIEYVDGLITLFRQASVTIGRERVGDTEGAPSLLPHVSRVASAVVMERRTER